MFQSEHSCKNLFLGAFLGLAIGALAVLYLGTSGGKRLQKDVLSKLEDIKELKKPRSKKRSKKKIKHGFLASDTIDK